MKKYLIVLALAALALTGCKEDVVKLTGIAIRPNTIDKFYVGDTTVLALVLTPREAAKPKDVVWTSSDTTVIKIVGNGRVAAVYPGTATITAQTGDLTASCQIRANYYELFWNIDWLYYFPSTVSAEPLNDSTYTFNGKPCDLRSVMFFCPNSNDFDEDLTTGEGTCLFADVAVLYYKDSVDSDGDLVMADKREVRFVETEEEWKKEPYTALTGQLNAAIAGEIYDEYIAKAVAGDQSAKPDWERWLAEAAKGAHLCDAEIDGNSVNYTTAPWDGLVVSGEAKRVGEPGARYITYDVTVDWLGGWWGIAENPNADEEDCSTWLLKPYEVYSYAKIHYTWENELGEIISTPDPQRRKAPAKIAATSLCQKKTSKAVRYIKNTKKVGR